MYCGIEFMKVVFKFHCNIIHLRETNYKSISKFKNKHVNS
jgi:hypothetical protein